MVLTKAQIKANAEKHKKHTTALKKLRLAEKRMEQAHKTYLTDMKKLGYGKKSKK